MELKLSSIQSKVWSSDKRFKLVVTGRRSGKTFLAILWSIEQATKRIGEHWYVAPTRERAKSLAWNDFKRYLRGHLVKEPSETELRLELKNGSVIVLKSADNPDVLHGSELKSVVLDEARFYHPLVFSEAILPATGVTKAPVLFISTPPRENNWFTDLIHNVRYDSDYEEEWEFFQFTTLEAGQVPPEEIEMAKRTLDPVTFAREYEANVDSMDTMVYSQFNKNIHVREDIDADINNLQDIFIGMDFNKRPMSAIISYMVGQKIYVFDEIIMDTSNTPEMADEIMRRYGKRGIGIHIRPDPAGHQGSTTTRGATNISILEEYGFEVFAPRKHARIRDRINAVQAALMTASGDVSLYIHPRCKQLIMSLSRQTYKEGTLEPDKDPRKGYDHANDALGYLVLAEKPILQIVPKFDIKFA